MKVILIFDSYKCRSIACAPSGLYVFRVVMSYLLSRSDTFVHLSSIALLVSRKCIFIYNIIQKTVAHDDIKVVLIIIIIMPT